jgi:formyl-CoA transferase
MRHAGALVPFADGRGLTVMTPFHIDGVEKIPASRAPSVGQHNEAVLLEAGYTAGDVERLRGLGVVA